MCIRDRYCVNQMNKVCSKCTNNAVYVFLKKKHINNVLKKISNQYFNIIFHQPIDLQQQTVK